MPTEVISTIQPGGGGDYTSIQSWEAAGRYDLVAADESYVGEFDSSGNLSSGLNTRINFSAGFWNTDATRRIVVRPQSGEELTGITGEFDTGQPYAQHSSATTNIWYSNAHNVSIKGIQFHTDTTATAMVLNWGASEVLVEGCLHYWDRTGTSTNTVGLLDIRNADVLYRNNIFIHEEATAQGQSRGAYAQSTVSYDTIFQNCTCIITGSTGSGNKYGFGARNGTVLTCTNCYSAANPGGAGTAFEYDAQVGSTLSITTSHCDAVDADATVDEVTYNTTTFTNVTLGTLDLTPTSSSDLYDNGTTIGAFSEDINGLTRPSGLSWDIGAIERDAPTSIDITTTIAVDTPMHGGVVAPDSNRTSAYYDLTNSGEGEIGPWVFGAEVGQTFKGPGGELIGVELLASKTGSPTVTYVAKIYATTGDYGVSDVPTGAALATSSNTVDSTDHPDWATAGHRRIYFEFPAGTTLTHDTNYALILESTGGSSGIGSFPRHKGSDVAETEGHGGRGIYWTGTVWNPAINGSDILFTLLTDTAVIPYAIPSGSLDGAMLAVAEADNNAFLGGEEVTLEQIWNVALTHVGSPLVASTSETSEEANILNEIWEPFFEKFLTEAEWNDAIITATLSKATDSLGAEVTPPTRWSNVWALPSDFIRARAVNPMARQPQTEVLYEVGTMLIDAVRTRVLFTNTADCELIYLADIGNQVSLLRPEVAHACAMKLAAFMAPQFGKSEMEIQGLHARAEIAMQDAKATDSQEGSPKFFAESTLLRSRYRGRGRRR